MLNLVFEPRRSPTILCLGAHADDIEIGCGGTLLTLLERYPGMRVHWVVLSSTPERASEARNSADEFLRAAGPSEIQIHAVRDGFFPAEFSRLKEIFESLKGAVRPDIVFTHHLNDGHQDHRMVAEVTRQTFRGPLVLEYEVLKYDPDLGNPNLLVPLRLKHAQAKVRALMRHFASQRSRPWFVPETFFAMMRLRGVQAASPSGFAEGFHGAKLCLALDTAARPAEEGIPAACERGWPVPA